MIVDYLRGACDKTTIIEEVSLILWRFVYFVSEGCHWAAVSLFIHSLYFVFGSHFSFNCILIY